MCETGSKKNIHVLLLGSNMNQACNLVVAPMRPSLSLYCEV